MVDSFRLVLILLTSEATMIRSVTPGPTRSVTPLRRSVAAYVISLAVAC
jgi:hypothetical protein